MNQFDPFYLIDLIQFTYRFRRIIINKFDEIYEPTRLNLNNFNGIFEKH